MQHHNNFMVIIHKYIEIRETGYKTEYNIVVAVGVYMYVCDVI